MEKKWGDLAGECSRGVDARRGARTGMEINLSNEGGEGCVENHVDANSRYPLGIHGFRKHHAYDYYYICQNFGEQREEAPWGKQLVFGEE